MENQELSKEDLIKKVEELEKKLQEKENKRLLSQERKILKKTGLKKLTNEELEELKIDYTNLLKSKKPIIEGQDKIKLQKHQKRFIESYLYSNLRSAIIFHGVGTGKTFTAVATTKAYLQIYPENKVILICPPALLFNFIDSMIKYGLNPQDKRFSYFSYTTFTTKKIDTKNSLLIIDEAHNLRTQIEYLEHEGKTIPTTGKRPFLTIEKAKDCHKSILLTATPFINTPYDIENLLAIGEGRMPYNKDIFGNLISDNKGRYDYFKYRISKFMNPSGDKNFPEKKEKYISFVVDESSEEARKIKAIATKENPAYVYSRLDSFVNDKIYFIVNEMNKQENKNKKFVIYSNYIAGVDKIIEILNENDINKISVISGKINTRKKAEAIDDYNNNKTQCMIITRAGAEGVSLNETRAIFILDGVWNEALYVQIVARAIRYKSHSKLPENERYVNVYKLFVCFEYEKKILDKINNGKPFNYMEFLSNFKTIKDQLKFNKKNKKFSIDQLQTLKKGSEERRNYIKNNMKFAKNKDKFIVKDIMDEFQGYPSIDFYMFVLQKSKLLVIDNLIDELEKIPVIEKTISDMPEVKELFDYIHQNKMLKKKKKFIDYLRNILNKEEFKAERFLKNSINDKETNLNKFIESKKEISDLLKAKIKLRVKQEFFTPEQFVDELIDFSNIKNQDKNIKINILEPSAGIGNIVYGLLKIIQQKKLIVEIDMVEIQDENRIELKKLVDIVPYMIQLQKQPDFLKFLSSIKYDYIFMNPPFHLQKKLNKDYNKDVYDYHFIMRAYAMLKKNGILVAITGIKYQTNKNALNFYKKVKAKILNNTVEWSGKNLKKGSEVNKLKISFIKIIKDKEDPELDNQLLEFTNKLVKNESKEEYTFIEEIKTDDKKKPDKIEREFIEILDDLYYVDKRRKLNIVIKKYNNLISKIKKKNLKMNDNAKFLKNTFKKNLKKEKYNNLK